jgi:hypothetical protein
VFIPRVAIVHIGAPSLTGGSASGLSATGACRQGAAADDAAIVRLRTAAVQHTYGLSVSGLSRRFRLATKTNCASRRACASHRRDATAADSQVSLYSRRDRDASLSPAVRLAPPCDRSPA